jgi:hypothetical protein
MAPKHHPTPLSGGDRKALQKELGRARAMTTILAGQSAEARAKGEALIRTADKLLCESWNERMWSDGEPIDPGHQCGLRMAGNPLRALQVSERRRPRSNEAPADHLRPRPREPAALPQMRPGGPASIRNPATIGLAAASSSNRNLTDGNPYSITPTRPQSLRRSAW